MNATQIPIITIDGPSGSGKGTLSALLAQKLAWHHLDSGALYRALALEAVRRGLDASSDETLLSQMAHNLDIHFVASNSHEAAQVFLGAEDVTDSIRTETCGALASEISVLRGVRAALLDRQQSFCKLPGLVADGRDMGTIVFPKAQHKFYLHAAAESRAQRRYWQLKRKGLDVTLHTLLEEVRRRDERDSTRSLAPLKPAAEAVLIDTTHMPIDEVLACVLAHLA